MYCLKQFDRASKTGTISERCQTCGGNCVFILEGLNDFQEKKEKAQRQVARWNLVRGLVKKTVCAILAAAMLTAFSLFVALVYDAHEVNANFAPKEAVAVHWGIIDPNTPLEKIYAGLFRYYGIDFDETETSIVEGKETIVATVAAIQ